MLKQATVLLLTVVACLSCVTASADPRTTNDAIYTEAQAEVGKERYEEHCIACHDTRYFRPVLKARNGQSLGLLFTMMSGTMPQSNPGALPRQDYVDILAYILSLNRYPAGDAALDYRNGELDEILIAELAND